MFTFEYEFYPKREVSLLDFTEEVLKDFLAALFKNGQLIDQHWNIIEDRGGLSLFCIAPEMDSLDAGYYNQHCRRQLARVIKLSDHAPTYKLLGPSLGLSDTCSCRESSFYILFTNFVAEYPPVSCGDCNLPVPLYRLPKLAEETDYTSLISWEAVYQACDALFLNTGVGEQFGYRQISQAESELSQSGLKLCKQLGELTGRPFYYYLHNWFQPPEDNCPLCGASWRLEEELHGIYAYKCDKCQLLADRP